MVGETPRQGDYGFISHNLTKGREQAGRLPVIVMTFDAFNASSGLARVALVTGRSKEIAFPEGHEISGVILLEHMRRIDPKARNFQYMGNVGQDYLDEEYSGDCSLS